MALMNGARLGIAAQSVGLSQAAYNEGLAYAKDRKQFGKDVYNSQLEYEYKNLTLYANNYFTQTEEEPFKYFSLAQCLCVVHNVLLIYLKVVA